MTRGFLAAVFAVALIGAGKPDQTTTRPSTRPAAWRETPEYRAASAAVREAEERLWTAKARADQRIAADQQLAQLQTAESDARLELEHVRASGSTQEKLDAGAKLNNAKAATAKRISELRDADGEIAAASKQVGASEQAADAARLTYLHKAIAPLVKGLPETVAGAVEKDVLAGHEPDDSDFGTIDVTSANIGDVGKLPGSQAVVQQVIDGNNVLIREAVAGGSDALVWIRGKSTKGLVDGRVVKFTGVFKVTNTKTYATALGSNTVPLLEPLDTSQFFIPSR